MALRRMTKIGAIGVSIALAGYGIQTASPSAAAGTQTIRINAGGPAVTDANGTKWSSDEYFDGGWSHYVEHDVADASTQSLYKDERWGVSGYNIPVSDGQYAVKLHFAEINPSSGRRVQTIGIEGKDVVTDYTVEDVVGSFKALTRIFDTTVSDGKLDLRFDASENSTSVSAIEVIPASASVSSPAPIAAPSPKPTSALGPVQVVQSSSSGGQSSVFTTSGEEMPGKAPRGWTRTFEDNFDVDAGLGEFPNSAAYDNKWGSYDGHPDTWGYSEFSNSKVLSVANGMLDMHLHTENGTHYVAAPAINNFKGQTYGRYSVRFKASGDLAGYKVAWLLWPDSDNWDEGEIDFPEGDLDETMSAFSHCSNIGNPRENCGYANTSERFNEWHTATIEWTPGKVVWYLDGDQIGENTKNVARSPMHWVLQTESAQRGPSNEANGHISIDWVTVDSMD